MNKLKIISTSDIFSILFSPVQVLNSKEDILKSFDYIIEYAIKEKIALFLIAGDTINNTDETETFKDEVKERLIKLAKADIKVVINANKAQLYTSFENENIVVSTKTELIKVETTQGLVQVINMPATTEKVKETLDSLLEKTAKELATILISDLKIEQTTIGAERYLIQEKNQSLPMSVFQRAELAYVALGSCLKAQIVTQKPPMAYSGSIERIHKSESKDSKYFVLFTLGQKEEFSFDNFIELPIKVFTS